MSWFKTYTVFSEEECNQIIKSVEDNYDKLKVSDEHGAYKISSYEINVDELSTEVINLVSTKLKKEIPISYKMVQCFVIKYSTDLKPDMPAHYDMTTYSCVINLNNNFEGGGTYFPLRRHFHNPKKHPIGEALVYRADAALSWHEALPVTNGSRYVLNIKYNKKRSFLWWMWAILKTIFCQFVVVKLFSKKYEQVINT